MAVLKQSSGISPLHITVPEPSFAQQICCYMVPCTQYNFKPTCYMAKNVIDCLLSCRSSNEITTVHVHDAQSSATSTRNPRLLYEQTSTASGHNTLHCSTGMNLLFIPSEARLYSGSIDLFRGGGHGPPSYPATSLAIAYQTSQRTLTFAIELCTEDLEAITNTASLLQPVVL